MKVRNTSIIKLRECIDDMLRAQSEGQEIKIADYAAKFQLSTQLLYYISNSLKWWTVRLTGGVDMALVNVPTHDELYRAIAMFNKDRTERGKVKAERAQGAGLFPAANLVVAVSELHVVLQKAGVPSENLPDTVSGVLNVLTRYGVIKKAQS